MVTIVDLQNSIAETLAADLDSHIKLVCQKFDLSPPKYSPDGIEKSYPARVAYVLSIIADKDVAYCRNLAGKILRKYHSSQLQNLLSLKLDPLPNQITRITREHLIEEFSDQGENLFGKCGLIEFLKRVWPIEEMPPIDSRNDNAIGDIETHFLTFKDWDLDYLLGNYFHFLTLPDNVIIHFIEQTVHPKVRKLSDQNNFASLINIYLSRDGFELRIDSENQSYPTYSVKPLKSNDDSGLLVSQSKQELTFSGNAEDLLRKIIYGIPRATSPLRNRRQDFPSLAFDNEYDLQALFHVLLQPWFSDIRAEEYTPSYAGTSSRIDFVLPRYNIVLELKYIRDKTHGKTVGRELTIDIAYYRSHPNCSQLWIIIYDPNKLINNPGGLKSDIEGEHTQNSQTTSVQLYLV